MSAHTEKLPSIDLNRRAKERLDHADAGNMLDALLARVKKEHPYADTDDLFVFWCNSAARDTEFNAQAHWYAFTRALARSDYQNSAPQERDEKQPAKGSPITNNITSAVPSSRAEEIRQGIRARTAREQAHKIDPRTLWLFTTPINGKRIAECTAGEVRAYVKTQRIMNNALLALVSKIRDNEVIGEARVNKFAKTEASYAA